MITKLRRRLTLLVIAVLVLVTAGIVLSIDIINRRNIDSTAEAALEILAENEGRRPEQADAEPPEKPDGTMPADPALPLGEGEEPKFFYITLDKDNWTFEPDTAKNEEKGLKSSLDYISDIWTAEDVAAAQ